MKVSRQIDQTQVHHMGDNLTHVDVGRKRFVLALVAGWHHTCALVAASMYDQGGVLRRR